MVYLKRSQISSITNDNQQTTTEQFQNKTLRPIIKALHPLIISVFRDYLSEKKGLYFKLDAHGKPLYIQKVFKTDTNLKLQFRGLVIGHFTIEEFEQYCQLKTEINRRINTILLKRVLDSADQFSESL